MKLYERSDIRDGAGLTHKVAVIQREAGWHLRAVELCDPRVGYLALRPESVSVEMVYAHVMDEAHALALYNSESAKLGPWRRTVEIAGTALYTPFGTLFELQPFVQVRSIPPGAVLSFLIGDLFTELRTPLGARLRSVADLARYLRNTGVIGGTDDNSAAASTYAVGTSARA